MNYVVDLDHFHGPMDLLLYLIEENQIDIYNIPLAKISEQYLNFIEKSIVIELDKLSDFLLMASYLLQLKARMILPKQFSMEESDAEDEIDPREELSNKLLDYKKFKEAAEYLMSLQEGHEKRVFYREEVDYQSDLEVVYTSSINTLLKAYLKISKQKDIEFNVDIPRLDINIPDKMDQIIFHLEGNPQGFKFQDLFALSSSKREVLALFLALLELVRMQKIIAVQNELFEEITLFKQVVKENVNT